MPADLHLKRDAAAQRRYDVAWIHIRQHGPLDGIRLEMCRYAVNESKCPRLAAALRAKETEGR